MKDENRRRVDQDKIQISDFMALPSIQMTKIHSSFEQFIKTNVNASKVN